ncbi:hypothetical protein [Brevundimonas bacteroides]|uniref:hypothetical protein n=1 Tax=Brevundimonas bacteroides TaxID=74311 RepID=UPI0004952BFB|nr:hypothetical protein [Brevundimonas bacteroides]
MSFDRRQFLGAATVLVGGSCDPLSEAEADPCEAGGPVTGPARRITIRMPATPGSSTHRLSPDGRTLLLRTHRALTFAPVDGAPVSTFPLEGPSFGLQGDDDSLAWSDDSRSVWLLKGDTAPSGFSTGPRACARRWDDGRIEVSPPLRDPPGRLDQMRWLNGAGLGIASFDTRGGYYRPELPNTTPALAVIDASSGRVRSPVLIREALLAAFDSPPGWLWCDVEAGVLMADGRVRALVRARASLVGQNGVDGLVLWTEGEAAVVLPEEALAGHVVFVEGGRRLLVRLPLAAGGVIYEHGPSPPPIPVSGDYAGLYDLESRRWIWRLAGRSTQRGEGQGLALSASGERALIGLPERCDIRGVYGIIDVRTGRVLQRLAATNNARPTLGFVGENPWMAQGVFLDLHEANA